MSFSAEKKKRSVYVLIALGFAGLIGAHEWAVTTTPPEATSNATIPLILAAFGTLCFIAAGLLARALMRDNARR